MSRRVVGLIVVVVAMLGVAAGCGLSLDESPQIISVENLPPELRPGQLPTPTPQPAASESGPGSDQVYMIQGNNRLVTVQRQIVDTPEQLMNILLLGTFPDEKAEDIETAIYRGTEVLGIEVNELLDVAVVDLAPGSLSPTNNSEQRLAFAQIVYTLTSLPGIEQVQFVQTDPENPDAAPVDLPVQTDTGTTMPGARVTRADFAELDRSDTAAPSFDIPLPSPTPIVDPDAPDLFDLAVWMLDDRGALTKVTRRIEATPDAYLVALLEGPTAEERDPETGEEIRSAIPPDALANPIEIGRYDVIRTDEFGFESLQNLSIATVDFEPGSLPSLADDDEQFLAIAQVVYTLTQMVSIDQVAVSVDGVFIPMPIDGGELTLPFEPNITRGVDTSDYRTALLSAVERAAIQSEPSALPTRTPDPAAPTLTPTPGG